jgi:antitoxin YobK
MKINSTLSLLEELMDRYPDDIDVSGAIDDELILKAEEYLDLRFPISYKEFLRRYGSLGLGPDEIYGIINENFQNSSIPNGVWYTQKKRNEIDFPKNLFVIFNADGVELYCIDTKSINADGECPVVLWDVSSGKVIGNKSEDFAHFLGARLEAFEEIVN